VTSDHTPAAAWDAEYNAGRYRDEPPVAFTRDILAAARQDGVVRGLYIGCGNGPTTCHWSQPGWTSPAWTISAAAIAQLAARAPGRLDRLICGDLTALPPGAAWPLIIGIQVFQHGDRAAAHDHIRAAQQRATPGGLFCLRVNATQTDIWPAHEVTERGADGGLTVRYLAGPKQGLLIHFFTATELGALFANQFTPVVPLQVQRTWRTPPQPGQWSQWEAIWRKSR
jgi:hypothetical protein